MKSSVSRLEDILKAEVAIYNKIADLELLKSDAIIAKNGKELEEYSLTQENYLGEISALEESRVETIENYKHDNHLDDMSRQITLSEVADLMDEESALRVRTTGMELKKLVYRIKSLNENNEKLMNDNMEFFNIFISSLKNSVSLQTGYSQKGTSNDMVKSSLIFNKTV